MAHKKFLVFLHVCHSLNVHVPLYPDVLFLLATHESLSLTQISFVSLSLTQLISSDNLYLNIATPSLKCFPPPTLNLTSFSFKLYFFSYKQNTIVLFFFH